MHVLRWLFVAILPLCLTSCLINPVDYVSEMVIYKDGRFSYSYKGKIHFVGLMDILKDEKAEFKFIPSPCYKDDVVDEDNLTPTSWWQESPKGKDNVPDEPPITEEAPEKVYDDWAMDDSDLEERECTKEELEIRRERWDEERSHAAEEDEEMMLFFRKFMGEVPLDSAEAIEKLVAIIAKQKGWNTIRYIGNGLFEADYVTTGYLSHVYQFPVLEELQAINSFVTVYVRNDNKVKVLAPGFGGAAGMSNEMLGELMGFGARGVRDEHGAEQIENNRKGVFTLKTDAEILTNNTEEGPEMEGDMKVLRWQSDEHSDKTPESLIKLAQ